MLALYDWDVAVEALMDPEFSPAEVLALEDFSYNCPVRLMLPRDRTPAPQRVRKLRLDAITEEQ